MFPTGIIVHLKNIANSNSRDHRLYSTMDYEASSDSSCVEEREIVRNFGFNHPSEMDDRPIRISTILQSDESKFALKLAKKYGDSNASPLSLNSPQPWLQQKGEVSPGQEPCTSPIDETPTAKGYTEEEFFNKLKAHVAQRVERSRNYISTGSRTNIAQSNYLGSGRRSMSTSIYGSNGNIPYSSRVNSLTSVASNFRTNMLGSRGNLMSRRGSDSKAQAYLEDFHTLERDITINSIDDQMAALKDSLDEAERILSYNPKEAEPSVVYFLSRSKISSSTQLRKDKSLSSSTQLGGGNKQARQERTSKESINVASLPLIANRQNAIVGSREISNTKLASNITRGSQSNLSRYKSLTKIQSNQSDEECIAAESASCLSKKSSASMSAITNRLTDPRNYPATFRVKLEPTKKSRDNDLNEIGKGNKVSSKAAEVTSRLYKPQPPTGNSAQTSKLSASPSADDLMGSSTGLSDGDSSRQSTNKPKIDFFSTFATEDYVFKHAKEKEELKQRRNEEQDKGIFGDISIPESGLKKVTSVSIPNLKGGGLGTTGWIVEK
ncbi:hypothetical protein BKA69DRAFT_1172796 [Paraphysoderma sedebokerense]|nr:hypothetical protein BKA69DRAFT_1173260 [Paraphysoderma sedebokerense]KAI9144421.1 hypothetical protein BKA69DRAFT_1172796 [Paraphysoderma sedebokerense]